MRTLLIRAFLPLLTLLSGFWLTGCQQDGEALTDRKRRENEQEIQQYLTANKLQATQLGTTGLYYVKNISAPNNQTAGVGDEIQFFAKSSRLDGTVLDSTDGKNPIFYTYGTSPQRFNTLINNSYLYKNITNGMFLGLTVARTGENLTLLVPSYLDDGRVGSLVLPQYSPIRYDLRVKSIRTEDQQIEDYIAANKINVTKKLDNGIRIATTLARPDSALITPGQSVTVAYTGRLTDGTVFDNSRAKADTTFAFEVGRAQVVQGWELGIQQVRRGEKFFLIFPSALGYGTTGSGTVVTPFKPLAFEMAVLRVK
ncbi:FKBP-type peptidyl-prolyl cis-trans isomerase [Fibrella aquatilis]|uniref:Peptidyl-prolyl cis-trans isomerase n=1 Tax=Fibrella aquatilis TaxID=2817059 RepID=A0A939GCY5_9BACT|nr:FKBP-type peptidyl-prolyl cis-trans isomerase [Fibrella aquatilis]MBO0934386.1 FKBP-type peptidyl-prolyl cis-trans isomerase [Fibrella aquatilis]